MKKEIYYRYLYRNKGIFVKMDELLNKETGKRFGKEWAKEYSRWVKKENKISSWLFSPESKKGIKFYFKRLGKEKYEKTLLKFHREMLNPAKTIFKVSKRFLDFKKIKLIKKVCFRKDDEKNKILYNFNTKRKIGKIIYEDRNQIGVI